jgi:hypothetical protein
MVAASPMVREPGLLPHRIVTRDLGDQHVVHTHVFETRKKPWRHQGDCFPKRGDAPTAGESDGEALRKAWARFEEGDRRSLGMKPPPVKRLAEVSDIAESIINALLPEDQDDRRDLIDEDYPLQSDIETFEQVTGQMIKPGDDEPILGKEIELRREVARYRFLEKRLFIDQQGLGEDRPPKGPPPEAPFDDGEV